jgi:archaellum biogenesis protein FlaJ (TadC family)
MSNFCYVNPKNSLSKNIKLSQIVNQISGKITDIQDFRKFQTDLELLKMTCIMVEHAVNNKKEKIKIDKKDIVFQVYIKSFGKLTPENLKDIDQNINYLWENNQIVKKKFWSVIKHSICDWIERKILN